MNDTSSTAPGGVPVPRHDVPAGGRSGFAVIDGRQVHYLEWGPARGPAVVCLHGGGQTAYMYEELGAALAGRYHVLAPDLPDHGDSDAAPGPERHHSAATVPALCAHFGLDRVVMIGASWGGMLTISVAATDPALVAGVVLIDVGHQLEEEGVRRIIDFMRAHESFASLEEAAAAIAPYLPFRKAVRAANLRRNLRQRDDGRWVWKHRLGRSFRLDGGGRDWRQILVGLEEEAARVRCPVLLLRGAASDVLSDAGASEVTKLMPNARLAVVKNAGHLAAGDNPDSTIGLVRAFLREIGW
jgi:pimeloyl-ACP methyl ester carboxylesterase